MAELPLAQRMDPKAMAAQNMISRDSPDPSQFLGLLTELLGLGVSAFKGSDKDKKKGGEIEGPGTATDLAPGKSTSGTLGSSPADLKLDPAVLKLPKMGGGG